MTGVITTGNISRLLQEGVKNVFGQAYQSHETQWMMLFNEEQSKKAFEQDQQFEGFGLAPVKNEGASEDDIKRGEDNLPFSRDGYEDQAGHPGHEG